MDMIRLCSERIVVVLGLSKVNTERPVLLVGKLTMFFLK